jgi:hypothetical protein
MSQLPRNTFSPPWNFTVTFTTPSPSPSLTPPETTPPPARCTRSSSEPLTEPLKEFRRTRSDKDKSRQLQKGLQLARQLQSQRDTRHLLLQEQRLATEMAAAAEAAAAAAAAAVSDKLHPAMFHGKPTENAVDWLDYFIIYTDYKKLAGDNKLPFLKLLMRGTAADWLARCGLTTWATVGPAFRVRFAQTELRQWQNASECWSRKQSTSETTDDYVGHIQKMAALAGLDVGDQGPKIVYMAVVQGLRPSIRAHVLQSGADNIEKLLTAARIAEVTEPETSNNDTLQQLASDVSKLTTKLESLSVGVVTDRASVEDRRPGGFQGQQALPAGHGTPGSGNYRGQGWQGFRGGRGHGGRPAGWMNQPFGPGRPDAEMTKPETYTPKCYRCGRSHSRAAYCFAANLNCRGCGVRGHILRVCMRGKRSGVPGHQ